MIRRSLAGGSRRTGRRHRAWIALTVAPLLLLAGCGASPGTGPGEDNSERMASWAQVAGPATLDPASMSDAPSTMFVTNTHDPLLMFDADSGEFVPQLATEWEVSEDAKTFTFTLREGVTFHDGATLTAAGVKAAIERMQELGTGYAYLLTNIASIEAPAEDQLVVTLSDPDLGFLGRIAMVFVPSPKALEEHSGEDGVQWFGSNEAGSGPYMMESFTPNNEVRMVKFDDYWGGWEHEHVSKIRHIVMDPTTQALNLRQGQVEAAAEVPLQDVNQFAQDDSFTLLYPPGGDKSGMPIYLPFNMESPRMADVRVRQAIAESIPYDEIIENVYMGYAARLAGPAPSWMEGFDPELKPVETDLDSARSLMQEAGYSTENPLKLNMVYCTCQSLQESLAAIVQQRLGEIGIDLTVEGAPWPTLVERVGNAETRPDIGVVGMGTPTPDAITILLGSFDPANAGNWQYWGYNDAAGVELMRGADRATTVEERTELTHQAQQKLWNDYAAVWLVTMRDPIVTRSELAGVESDFTSISVRFYRSHFVN